MIPLEDSISMVKGFLLKRGRKHGPAVRSMISFVQNTVQELRFQNAESR